MSERDFPSSRHLRMMRALFAGLLVSLFFVGLAPGARAASSFTAEKTAWFWMSNSKVTTCTNDGTADLCGGASGNGGVFSNGSGAAPPISAGHLGVALKNGDPDMRAYVFFDLGNQLRGATVNGFQMSLLASIPSDTAHAQEHASTQSKPPATANADQAVISACLVREPWGPTEGDPPFSTTVIRPAPPSDAQPHVETVHTEPNYDCSVSANGERAKDGKTWTFDLTPMAKLWAAGATYNEGVALVPVHNGIGQTWTVEFHGAPSTVAGADGNPVTYVTNKEAPQAEVDFVPGFVAPPPPPTSGTGGGISFPTFQNPVPADTGSYQPPPAPAPVADTQVPLATTPVALKPFTPAWFVLLFPLVLVGLFLVSNMIGADPLTGQAMVSNSRVARVLRARRLAGDEGIAAATEAIAAEESASLEQ